MERALKNEIFRFHRIFNRCLLI